MRNRIGRTGALVLHLVALGLFARVPVASAWEWYLGGFVGGAIPQNTDFRFTGFQEGLFSVLPATILATSEAVEASAKGRSLEPSLAGGAKAGACPPFFPYLCAELEFDYFQPDMAGQSPFQQPFRYIEDLLTRLPLARFDFHLETTPDSRMVPPLD